MKTQEEIEQMLIDTQLDLDYVNNWCREAYKRYNEDRAMWGNGDRGELDSSYDAQKVLMEKVNVLNWVLGK